MTNSCPSALVMAATAYISKTTKFTTCDIVNWRNLDPVAERYVLHLRCGFSSEEVHKLIEEGPNEERDDRAKLYSEPFDGELTIERGVVVADSWQDIIFS